MDIARLIEQKVRLCSVCNVIIAGGTCSGKTTLAGCLERQLSEAYLVTVMRQDSYFKDICDVPRIRKGYLMDSPNAFHAREFKNDAERLLAEGTAIIPRYDVAQNKRISKDVPMTRGQVNIFEGLHAIDLLDGLPDTITVFIATPLDICLKRRISRDAKLYGITEERVREHFNDCIAPMYHSYIAPQMERAEISIEGMGFHGAS